MLGLLLVGKEALRNHGDGDKLRRRDAEQRENPKHKSRQHQWSLPLSALWALLLLTSMSFTGGRSPSQTPAPMANTSPVSALPPAPQPT